MFDPLQHYNNLSSSGKETLHITLLGLFVTGIATLIYRNYSEWTKLLGIFLKKIFLKIFPQQQVVTFCVKHNEINSGIYYEAIKSRFLHNLEQYKLDDIISYKDYSDIYFFKNTKEAERFRNKKDLSLILWGAFTNDKLKKGGSLESEFLLSFTYEFNYSKYKNNREIIQKEFDKRIGQFLALKNKWSIRENESLQDVANVADGMFTVAIFTVALTLLNRGDVEKSTFVFNQLHKYLNQRTDVAASLLKPYVRQCSAILVKKAYREKKPDWKSIASLSQKIVDIQQDLDSLVTLAYSQYKSGNKEGSRNIVGRLMNSYPKSNAARVNFAFFQMLDGKYKDALRNYLQIFKVKNPDFSTVEIIDFLSTEYESAGEIGFLFVSAGISYYHNQDYVLAKHDIKKFLSKASLAKYGDMYLEGQRLLVLINQQKKV
jgi:hypothetical protein